MGVKVRFIGGRWKVMVDFHQHRKSRTFQSEEKARDFAQRVRTALELYGFGALDLLRRKEAPKAGIPTVEEFSRRWLDELDSSTRALSTRLSYRFMIRKHVLPAFGRLRLDEIAYPSLKAFVVSKAGRYSKGTVRLMIATLGAMCSEAVREELIARNPVAGADLGQFVGKRFAAGERRPDPFTLEELHAVEAQARASFPEHWPLVCCLARTGMRISEALGLEWRHVDFRERYLLVEQSLPQHGHLGETKSRAGRRRVEISEELAEVLKSLRAARRREWLARGSAEIPAWVFCTAQGKPIDYKWFLPYVWRRLMDKARVRPRTPHDLRHTFATLHLAAGASPVWVKEQLGHSSIQMTVDTYYHWIPRSDRSEANRLDTQQTRISGGDADESAGQDAGK